MRWTTALVMMLFASTVRAQTPASAWAEAVEDCRKLPASSRPYTRYLSSYSAPVEGRKAWSGVASFVVNSLSRGQVIVQPKTVSATLVRVNLEDYRIEPTAWDKLGELGSGKVPQPEPYFHRTLETEAVREDTKREWWPGGYENGRYYAAGWYTTTVKMKGEKRETLAVGGWIPKEAVLELTGMTESLQPIYRIDWFAYSATLEPRYHELLGLGEKESDFAKLGAADERLADEEGAQARGAVVFSEVAQHNRILERTPTIRLYGRGWYAKSFDFASSVKLEDVLENVDSALTDKAGAHEIITSLRNGLQAYFVTDDKGKRLDEAGTQFAQDKKNGFREIEVRPRNCMVCHAKGMISVDDEVRATAKGPIAAAAVAYAKKDKRQAERFLEKYAAAPLDDLLKADGAAFETAVKSANGLTGAVNGQQFLKLLLTFEGAVTLADMAREVGCTEAEAKTLIPTIANPNHTLVAAVGGRKALREQWEAKGFSQLAEALKAKNFKGDVR